MLFMYHCRYQLNEFQSLFDSINPIHIDVYFLLIQQFLHCSIQCFSDHSSISIAQSSPKIARSKQWSMMKAIQTKASKKPSPHGSLQSEHQIRWMQVIMHGPMTRMGNSPVYLQGYQHSSPMGFQESTSSKPIKTQQGHALHA